MQIQLSFEINFLEREIRSLATTETTTTGAGSIRQKAGRSHRELSFKVEVMLYQCLQQSMTDAVSVSNFSTQYEAFES